MVKYDIVLMYYDSHSALQIPKYASNYKINQMFAG